MLQFQSKFTIDPALCLGADSSGSGEILFVIDQCSRQDEWVTVGSVKLVDQQILESSHVLTAFTGNRSHQQKQTSSSSQSSHRALEEERARGPQLASGMISSGTKLVAYSTEGHLTCFDRQLSRRIPCEAATLVLMTKRRKPVMIRCAAAARSSDDLFFFSLVGSRSLYVLYFVDSREEGGVVARMSEPIRIESTALEHDGIALLECHPSLSYVVVAGIEGPAEVYSYAPLLQRIRAQTTGAAGDGRHHRHANLDGHGEGHEDQDDDEREPETGSSGTATSKLPPRPRQLSIASATNATKSTGTTAALRKGIFSLFGQQVEVVPDFVLTAVIHAPTPPPLQPSSFGNTVVPPMSRVHKLSMHPSGSLMAVVFEYHTRLDPVPAVPTTASPSRGAAAKSSTESAQSRRATLQSSCVCVYDITAAAMPSSSSSSSSGQDKTRRGSTVVVPTLEALATNHVKYCETDYDLNNHQTDGGARQGQGQGPARQRQGLGAVRQEHHHQRAHRAVFAVCFHPSEPLLLLGVAARYIGRQVSKAGSSGKGSSDIEEEDEDYDAAEGGEAIDRQEVTLW